MVKDMSYTTISRVIESWDLARRKRDFEDKLSTLALLKLFELEPRTKRVFGFDINYNPSAKELVDSGNLIHAIRMIHMFDAAFSMLGPDTETLTEILQDLGKRHIKYGVSPHFFPFMGQALVYALRKTLGPRVWSPELQEAWVEVYEELSGEIMRTILNGTRDSRTPSPSWSRHYN